VGKRNRIEEWNEISDYYFFIIFDGLELNFLRTHRISFGRVQRLLNHCESNYYNISTR